MCVCVCVCVHMSVSVCMSLSPLVGEGRAVLRRLGSQHTGVSLNIPDTTIGGEETHYSVSQDTHVLMREEKEERKKQARSNKQTRQRATQHTQSSHFS